MDNELIIPDISILRESAHLFDGDRALELFTLNVA